MNISELKSDSKNVELTATIIELSNLIAKDGWQRKDAKLEDNSGTIKFQLWDKHANIPEIGDTVTIKAGYVKEYKGVLSLNVGKYSTVTVVGHEESTAPAVPQRLSGSVVEDIINGLTGYAREAEARAKEELGRAQSFREMAEDLRKVKQ